MRVAVISNFEKEISPVSGGGTEVFIYTLVSGLVKKSSIDSVHVYGVGKNNFDNAKIKFISLIPQPTAEYLESNESLKILTQNRLDLVSEFKLNMVMKVFKSFILSKHKYDIIHDNSTSPIFNSLGDLLDVPIVTTIHTNLTSSSILFPNILNLIDKNHKYQYFVSVANHQKKLAEINNVNIYANVYNGIDINRFSFSESTPNNSYGLWIGRINRRHNKGVKEALLTSKKINKPLVVLCTIDDREYFEESVEPNLGEQIKMTSGTVKFEEKNEYYKNASYFIYPIQWEESFGLVFVEAMACGTPVIAFAKGAVPEIIKDGETGFIVNQSDKDIRGSWIVKKTGVEGLCEAVEKLSSMSSSDYKRMRNACRIHVEKNFTVEKMIDGYEKLYKKILINRNT